LSGDGLENFRLSVFRAVADEMSFRKAAEVLHLSQPAVSQHIHALEEEAGVQLFDRARGEGHGSQISLTEAGRVLLGYANTAAETMVEARRALAALNHEIVESVAEKKVALGIIEGPAMRRDVKTERMVKDEMVLIVSPNHTLALRKGAVITPAELAKLPLLLRERGSGSRRVVERALKKVGIPLRSLGVAMELDSTEAIISGVEAELGVGFVSRWAVGKVLRLATVRVVAVEGLEIVRDFSFVRLAGSELRGAAAAFQRFAMVSAGAK